MKEDVLPTARRMIIWTCPGPGIRLLEEERGRRLRRNRLVERLRRASQHWIEVSNFPGWPFQVSSPERKSVFKQQAWERGSSHSATEKAGHLEGWSLLRFPNAIILMFPAYDFMQAACWSLGRVLASKPLACWWVLEFFKPRMFCLAWLKCSRVAQGHRPSWRPFSTFLSPRLC